MVTITDQNIRIGGLRVRNSPHETIGDCRCYDCVELLAEVYRAHNIPIRTALRCARCNIILSHPQWLDKENTHYHIELRRAYHKAKSDKVPLANVCCNCLQNIQSLYDNGPPQPSYHIRSGILGAEARRRRREQPTHLLVCTDCDNLFTHILEDEPLCATCASRATARQMLREDRGRGQ